MDIACFLEPNEGASSRTINRIKNHGPCFTILDRKVIQRFPGDESLLVETDTWTGWLPANELTGIIVDD